LGDITIGQIESVSLAQDVSLIEAAKIYGKTASKRAQDALQSLLPKLDIDKTNLAVNDCLSELVERFEVEKWLLDKYGEEDAKDRVENVRQLINSAGEYVVETGDKSIEGYLQAIALLSSSDKETEEGRVTLMTLHAAKGLEFPIVFMVGLMQGILPHYLSIDEDPVEGLEEERRLCYVGMTRAKHLLIMSHCKNRKMFGRGQQIYFKKCAPSQFLAEANLLKNNP
jgi:DNA helicase-2/ATP-dependent DNA helicase PcrA